MRDADECNEADAGEAEGYDDEWPSALMSISEYGEEDCADDSKHIDGHCQELRATRLSEYCLYRERIAYLAEEYPRSLMIVGAE